MRKYYVGLDVHKVSIAIAVLDAHGKLITRTVIETSTEAVRDFFRNLGEEIHLTFEEGKTLIDERAAAEPVMSLRLPTVFASLHGQHWFLILSQALVRPLT